MKIYLIRHGETKDNVRKLLSGSRDAELSENGVKQANLVANFLSNISFDYTYSSTLSRASLTLEAILNTNNFIRSDLLKERNFGEFEGKSHQSFYDAINKFNPKEEYAPKNGESYLDLEKRVENFWDKFLKDKEGKVCIVAHGAFNLSFLKVFLSLSYQEQFNLKQGNTCINILEGNKLGHFKALEINSVEHLR